MKSIKMINSDVFRVNQLPPDDRSAWLCITGWKNPETKQHCIGDGSSFSLLVSNIVYISHNTKMAI